MKKCLLVLLYCLCGGGIFAQDRFQSGIRLGAGVSRLDGVENANNVLFLTLGATSTYQITPRIDLNAEGLLAFEGSEYHGVQEVNNTLGFPFQEPYEGDLRVVSFQIPLYPAIGFGSGNLRFRAYAGPSLNINLYGYESRDYEDEAIEDTEKEEVERIDPFSVAVLAGAGLKIRASESKVFLVDLRVAQGLSVLYSTAFNVNPAEGRLQYIVLSAGYLF